MRTAFALSCLLILCRAGNLPLSARQPRPKKPHWYAQVHVLLIGIDEYKHLRAARYSEDDAQALGKLLQGRFGFTPDYLLGKAATGAAIEKKLKALEAKLGPKDSLLVFFAGHGTVITTAAGKRRGFLLPYDADVRLDDQKVVKDVKRWERHGIDMQKLVDRLEKLKAQHVVLMSDACCSGFLTHAGDRSLEGRVDLQVLLKGESRMVLAATTDQQGARWDDKRKHGIFTAVMLDMLEQFDNDREAASVTDLFVAVRKKVPHEAHRTMTPQMGRVGAGAGEFVFLPLSIRAAEVAAATNFREGARRPECVRGMLERVVERKNGRTRIEDVLAAYDGAYFHYNYSTNPVERGRLWKERVRRYTENASLGDALAMAALHYCYAAGLGVKKDEQAALKWAQLAYDTGHPAGKHVLGRCYLNGIEVRQNERAGDSLLEEAAKGKFPISVMVVGLSHKAQGRTRQAEALLEQAVKANVHGARYYLADIRLWDAAQRADKETNMARSRAGFARDLQAVIDLLMPGAKSGHPLCQYELASLHATWDEYLDRKKAAGWLTQAAENGHAYAQFVLARNLAPEWWMIRGDTPMRLGLKPNPFLAKKWVKLAVDQGVADAYVVLANLYRYGNKELKIPADWDEAKKQCDEAIKKKSACAIVLQSSWHLEGKVLDKDLRRAFRLALKAAATEDSRALLWLAALYADRSVPVDMLKPKDQLRNGTWVMRHYALHYYTQAAAKGLSAAKDGLRECLKEMQEDEDKARKAWQKKNPKKVPPGGAFFKPVYWHFFVRDFPDSAKKCEQLARTLMPRKP
jgi:TPR repeat protein